LLVRRLAWSTHQQILRLLIHREKRDLAQVLRPDKQHHDTVNPCRHATMRRRAILERAIHTAETLFKHAFIIARKRERLFHNFRLVISNSAGADFITIAHHIILIGADCERILVF